MKKMYLIAVMVFLASIMAGCASGPQYRAAKNGGNGYSDIKVANDRYRVQYTSTTEDVLTVTNHALFRAAELSKMQGYDWYVVTSRETFVDREEVKPNTSLSMTHAQTLSRDCGLLTCTERRQPVNTMGVELASNRARTEVQSILEVRMGKGMQPNEDSYSVADVLENLQPK
ncbi:MAG: hypothetical protein NWQ54_17405 [Paraglaciecola sp.]|uniref:CC0125/CC1285 family lipoprotein n=1 Tax=Paraglaciecola sp. TaxID=1920173 RepID=UPI00273F7CE4|nr:hypothetical protein [Paraglaciecola sp.]MDP5030939.1 hypothetical protein [Paraglaciecola sp.]MDP5132653.1 hypothetical protein [Paraglaciecola sp.]